MRGDDRGRRIDSSHSRRPVLSDQQSTTAAKEIKNVDRRISLGDPGGRRYATTTHDAVSRTVDAIGQLNAIMNEIAAAFAEQGRDIDQRNIAFFTSGPVTQQNVALVEPSVSLDCIDGRTRQADPEAEAFVVD
jgi:hypothetical protein